MNTNQNGGVDESNIVMYIPSNEENVEAGQEYLMILDEDQNVQQYKIVNVVGTGNEQVPLAESPDDQGVETEESEINEEYEDQKLWPDWFMEFRDNPLYKQSRVFFPVKSLLDSQLLARCKHCNTDVIVFIKENDKWKYNTIRMAYHKRSCKQTRLELQDDQYGKYLNPDEFPQWFIDFVHDAKFEQGFCFQPVKSLTNNYRLGDCIFCKKRFIIFKKKEEKWMYNLANMKTHKEKCVGCRKAIDDKKEKRKIALQNTNIADIMEEIPDSDDDDEDESYPDWFKLFCKNKNLIKSKYFKPLKQNVTGKRIAKCVFCNENVIVYNLIDGNWNYNCRALSKHKTDCKGMFTAMNGVLL